MSNASKHPRTNIWFKTDEQWETYQAAKAFLAKEHPKQTVSTWFHQELKKYVNGKRRINRNNL